jgi:hypothetical protein
MERSDGAMFELGLFIFNLRAKSTSDVLLRKKNPGKDFQALLLPASVDGFSGGFSDQLLNSRLMSNSEHVFAHSTSICYVQCW